MRITNAMKVGDTTPLQIVIFGGSGDLSKRKLLPALLDLYTKGKLPKEFSITGLARTPRSHDEYRQFVADALVAHGHNHSQQTIKDFCAHIEYVAGAFGEDEAYTAIKETLREYDREVGQNNKLFYLAVPPESYHTIFDKLHEHKMHAEKTTHTAWSRILVEKPFGKDFKAARKLDRQLTKLFTNEQIFRIDHYLAKEAVQNVLSFRFANPLIEHTWNKDSIESIKIIMHETVDADDRGAFYDGIGALRDVGQNHLLQLLALLTMAEPKAFTADEIHEERHKMLADLQSPNAINFEQTFKRGQYQGYTKAKGVATNSDTETWFEHTLYLKTKRWRNVPITISTGKALKEAKVEVLVEFKNMTGGLFETASCRQTANHIRLTISPEQSMHITLNAKQPGLGFMLEPRTLTFDCEAGEAEIKNAYERVLLDCMKGDRTLFTSNQEVMASWRYINKIMQLKQKIPLQSYKKGSDGPKDRLITNH